MSSLVATVDKNLIPAIGGFGILGNIISILVFQSSRLKSTFYQSLLTLAVCDILLLVFIMIDATVSYDNVIFIYIFPYFYNPLKNIVFSWETYLIMSIATERYLVVGKPLLYRRHKVRNSSLMHLMTFILPALFLAILINIPKFFEVKLTYANDTVDIEATSLRLNKDYIYYYTHLTRLILTGIIPTCYLVTTNMIIILEVRSKRKKSVVLGKQVNNTSLRQTPDYLVLTLTGVIVVFLVSNLPRLILNMLEYNFFSKFYKVDECGCSLTPWWITFLMTLSHMLLTINSGINVFIYIVFSKSFYNVLITRAKVFMKKLPRNQQRLFECQG